MAVFLSMNSRKIKWILFSLFYLLQCISAFSFNAGSCGQISRTKKMQTSSCIAFEEGNDNPRFGLRRLPLKCNRRMTTERSARPSMSSSENNLWKNRGPFTLTKETEWKLTLSLTGPPQDGQFGPGFRCF